MGTILSTSTVEWHTANNNLPQHRLTVFHQNIFSCTFNDPHPLSPSHEHTHTHTHWQTGLEAVEGKSLLVSDWARPQKVSYTSTLPSPPSPPSPPPPDLTPPCSSRSRPFPLFVCSCMCVCLCVSVCVHVLSLSLCPWLGKFPWIKYCVRTVSTLLVKDYLTAFESFM